MRGLKPEVTAELLRCHVEPSSNPARALLGLGVQVDRHHRVEGVLGHGGDEVVVTGQ